MYSTCVSASFGVGAVACGTVAGAAAGGVNALFDCSVHDLSGCAKGVAAGMLSGAVAGDLAAATHQYATTGRIDVGQVVRSAGIGLGFGGAAHGAGRGVGSARARRAAPSAGAPDGGAPNTARALHASDLVESPLWTATKNKTSAQNASRHFSGHGADFPDIQNSVEYVGKAQNFLRTPPGGRLTRVRANGDVARWHPSSNTFGVMDAGGASRTFFRPDPSVHRYANNWDYFYAQ